MKELTSFLTNEFKNYKIKDISDKQTNKQKILSKQKYTRRKNNKQIHIEGEGIFLTLERPDKSHERTKFWRDRQTKWKTDKQTNKKKKRSIV